MDTLSDQNGIFVCGCRIEGQAIVSEVLVKHCGKSQRDSLSTLTGRK